MTNVSGRRVAIVGGGPVGLAAAAHALERGLEPVVLEAGPSVGHAVRGWGHVRMFSPWTYDVDAASVRLLDASGWNAPAPGDYPTGDDLVDSYLTPLAQRTALSRHIRLASRVTAIGRKGIDRLKTAGRDQAPFVIRFQNGRGPEILEADAVIDASGTWFSPNPAGADGLPAPGEAEAGDRIAFGMPDVLGRQRAQYAGKRVAVLGSGHSAIGTLIDLVALADAEPATRPVWLLRGERPEKAFGGGAADQLAARGALGAVFARLVREGRIAVEASFAISRIEPLADGLRLVAGTGCCARKISVDELIVATGFRPDFSFARELRLALDPALECPPALAPLIDPNEHSCGTVRPHGARELAQPEPGFYIAGMKSYGRAPTFLLLTGYEQVRSIVAEIAGDREAADRVELTLPATGVCTGAPVAAEGCCGGPPVADDTACCVTDEQAKAIGEAGCGCAPEAPVATNRCCG